MAQSSRLLSLPPEIFLHIASYLAPADQVHLCTTSKAASNFIETLLWKDVELHDVGFHDSSVIRRAERPAAFHSTEQPSLSQRSSGTLQFAPEDRLLLHAGRHLQDRSRPLQATRRSYSQPMCCHRLHSGRREQGLLAAGLDDQSGIPATALDKNNDKIRSTGGESGDATIDNSNDGDDNGKNDSEHKSDRDDFLADYNSVNKERRHGFFAPRPLSISFSQDIDKIDYDFPKLKHLHLCKPTEGETSSFLYNIMYSLRARDACVHDWLALLKGTQKTLETLELEHRTCTDALCKGLRNCDIIILFSDGWDDSFFVGSVVPLLLADDECFKRLKVISLYGILVGYRSSMAEKDRLMDICWRHKVRCEGHLGTTCEFDEPCDVVSWNEPEDVDEPIKRSEVIWRA